MAEDAREHRDNQAGHGQPQYHGVPANALPLTASEDRQWATLAHFGGILGCVPSLLIYLIFKDRGPFTAQESKEALNFTLPPTIAAVLANLLVFASRGGQHLRGPRHADLDCRDLLLGGRRHPRQPGPAAPLRVQPALDQVTAQPDPSAGRNRAGRQRVPEVASVRQDPADHGVGQQPALEREDQPALEGRGRIHQAVGNQPRHGVPARRPPAPGDLQPGVQPGLEHDALHVAGFGVEGFPPCGR